MRVPIHVRPGAKDAQVGGSHGGALVVRVRQRAVDGQATAAALKALARALKVPAGEVSLVSGATSRRKSVQIPDDAAAAYDSLCRL